MPAKAAILSNPLAVIEEVTIWALFPIPIRIGPTSRPIRKETAGKDKKISLELGGKSAFIVFEDADLDSAIEGVVDSIWFNQGEVCCAGSRLLVQEGIQNKFITKLKRRMSKLRLGNPLDKSTDIGAINSLQQLKKIKSLVASGSKEGANIYQPKIEIPKKGYFYLSYTLR